MVKELRTPASVNAGRVILCRNSESASCPNVIISCPLAVFFDNTFDVDDMILVPSAILDGEDHRLRNSQRSGLRSGGHGNNSAL